MTDNFLAIACLFIISQAELTRSWLQKHNKVAITLSTLLVIASLVTACNIGFFSSTNNPCDPATMSPPSANGIGVSKASNGEYIGISDGKFAFDTTPNRRLGSATKCQASREFRAGNTQDAQKSWEAVHREDTSDAEALIYLENQRVQSSPHITLVVATTLTGPIINQGRDNLQGAYVAQKEFNDGSKLPNSLKVSLLIANFGSNPKDATTVAKQIVQAAQADKTIVGVMGLPLSAYVPDAIAILQQAHLPLISPTASSDELTGISPSFFRIVPPNKTQARVAAQYVIHTLHIHTMALFYDPKDSSSNNLASDLKDNLTTSSGVTVVEEKYTIGHPETLNALLTDAIQHQADLLYFAGYVADMNALLINLPPSSNLEVMGSDSFYQLQDYSIVSRPSFTRLHFTAFAYPDEWDILCQQGLSQACTKPPFFTSYPRTFDDGNHQEHPYGYTRANSNTIVSYDALSTLLTACQLALSQGQRTSLTPNQVQTGLKMITSTHPFQGVSGQISFGEDGDPIDKAIVLLYVNSDYFINVVPENGIQGCFMVGVCANQ